VANLFLSPNQIVVYVEQLNFYFRKTASLGSSIYRIPSKMINLSSDHSIQISAATPLIIRSRQFNMIY